MERVPHSRRNPQVEPVPPGQRHKDHPQYGGALFMHQDTGIAGCPECGWTGVPTVVDGVISSHCPACDAPKIQVPLHHSRSINRSKAKRRKAAKQARKRNR